MNYLIIWKEDDGDCRYYNWQTFKSLEEAIDFMATIEAVRNEEVKAFLESESEIKDIDIPKIPSELIEKKKREIKKREEEQYKEKERKWEIQHEKREREQYEMLKEKYGDE